MQIEKNMIGKHHRPLIVAEMSGNHNQSLERALQIVEAASQCGVHAIKLQTYTADTMTLDLSEGEFFIHDPKSLWQGNSLYHLYQQAYTPWEWHERLFRRCRELGMMGFSTPFDATAVDFLETLDVPCYKVASFENVDIPLLKKIATTGKPVMMSTGMATIAELADAVETLRTHGCPEVILLKCTSSYPATPVNSNLLTIPHLRDLFRCEVGLSDHTLGIGTAIASVALGATVIEKHFTLSRADGGVDAAFSIEPEEMRSLVTESERAWQALGSVTYGITPSEQASLMFRRSLYITKDMNTGEYLSENNMRAIRPGLGLAPKYYDMLIGKRVNRSVKRGTPMKWELLA